MADATLIKHPNLIPELAKLFKRPPSSVLQKMRNLDVAPSHGAAFDARAGQPTPPRAAHALY